MDDPIAPDESTGEPRCVATCPSCYWRICGHDPAADVEVDEEYLCLPRIRQLVAFRDAVEATLPDDDGYCAMGDNCLACRIRTVLA